MTTMTIVYLRTFTATTADLSIMTAITHCNEDMTLYYREVLITNLVPSSSFDNTFTLTFNAMILRSRLKSLFFAGPWEITKIQFL
jgi:hypothetical protein